uniref:Uncharacterized protein n=1 Tax=Cucumis melo TaxID=3656 RepID=A0A9I9EAL7_CUCME
LFSSKIYCFRTVLFEKLLYTTRKRSILDAKKDVGITDVGKKGVLDAVETPPGEALGKTFFPTHQTGVGHAT